MPDGPLQAHRRRVQPVGGPVRPGELARRRVPGRHGARQDRHGDVVLVEVLERRDAHVEHLGALPAELAREPVQRDKLDEILAARVGRAPPVRADTVDAQERVAAHEQQAELGEIRVVRLIFRRAVLQVRPQDIRVRAARVEDVVARIGRGDPVGLVAVRDHQAVLAVELRLCERDHRLGVGRQLLVDAVEAEHVDLVALQPLHL